MDKEILKIKQKIEVSRELEEDFQRSGLGKDSNGTLTSKDGSYKRTASENKQPESLPGGRPPKGKDLYFSSIQDCREGCFSISLPYRRNRALNLQAGDKVKITISGENEAFSFISEVIGKRHDPIPLVDLALPERIERIQRRQFVRLPVNIEVFLAESKTRIEHLTYFKASTIDLSEGGMRVRTSRSYPLETGLWVKFTLPSKDNLVEIATKARVIRTAVQYLDNGKFYETGLEFDDLPALQRDQIFVYILRRMIEQRKLFFGK